MAEKLEHEKTENAEQEGLGCLGFHRVTLCSLRFLLFLQSFSQQRSLQVADDVDDESRPLHPLTWAVVSLEGRSRRSRRHQLPPAERLRQRLGEGLRPTNRQNAAVAGRGGSDSGSG